ncbi:tetratricopeptide repeat protein [Rhodopirellula halodulae]|uniref:tetratricopeptide repeat protein n=1 Tax=Rhodopirellula halodulae TaxID=2894198 RepID=UPI001E36961A|nr:tetratricopeptide repeat protein [Rhodopirellula sp. JC737]MCC9657418.1 tetratricopeptide repeat protein [Rhodopirellula sp. JC737]
MIQNDPSPRPTSKLLGLVIAIIIVAYLLGLRACSQEPTKELRWFGREDLLVTSLLAALPLGFVLAHRLQSISVGGKVAIAGLAISLSWAMAILSPPPAAIDSFLKVSSFRILLATCATFGSCLLLSGAQGWFVGDGAGQGGRNSIKTSGTNPTWLWVLSLTMAIGLPLAYCHSAGDALQANLEKSLDDQRFSLAQKQCHQLVWFRPNALVSDTPLKTLRERINERVQQLTLAVSQPLPTPVTMGAIGTRITQLVQLDRNEEALRLIRPMMTGRNFHPIALDYYGLCQQRLENADESMRGYQRSFQHWERQPNGPAKAEAMASALKGIAYAARQSGNRRMEEDAYLALIQMRPTAENHFLLATCYKEHQKSTLAAQHANRAAELDPQYGPQAQSMVSQLSRDHFSCFLVPR